MALSACGYYCLLTFFLVGNECIDISSLEDITEATCTENCENVTEISSTEIYTQSVDVTKFATNENTDYDDETTENVNTLLAKKPQKSLIPIVPRKSNNTEVPIEQKPAAKLERTKAEICECDLEVSSCDINCCCDLDCTDSQLETFSFCSNVHEKLYDNRYCYRKNFLFHNTSKFILEKVADNLFCIVYDNLPPIYTVNNNVSIQNERDLDKAIGKIDPYNFKWDLEATWMDPKFQTKEPYRHGDTIWKLDKTLIEPLELLQTGFTGLCSFTKTVKFLENWKDSCLQINLSNNNTHLFPEKYSNFSIIKSPRLLDANKFNRYQKCSPLFCAPIESNYCFNSWTNCTKNKTNPTSCSNETCQNVIKNIRYIIKHNGTMGITDIQLYFQQANVTEKFYQKFEIIYEWFTDNKTKNFQRSGNPGYTAGNPIFIGKLMTNNTTQLGTNNIHFDKNNKYLTLPIAKTRTGICDNEKKYTVNFGENLKLKCQQSLRVKYFSQSTCIELQNAIFHQMLKKSFLNSTEFNANKMQISRTGNVNDRNMSNWIDIHFNQLPTVMPNSLINEEKLSCTNLITSLRIDVVHSILSKPEFIDNHVILGVGVTFANSTTISWHKCGTKNCVENLVVDIVSYVSFHDASKPSKIYFASGPNLDISLPYDFFYPFLSNSRGRTIYFDNILVICLFIAVIIVGK